ncbi:MAG: hypothetical protein NWQ29_00320 [Alphaproteobacteria bacterium]|nr:hypothetical protein [Alphaproteobacteria bacterium]MDP5012139.1 hypothetical protein [Alphaproteobacteria bacterium]
MIIQGSSTIQRVARGSKARKNVQSMVELDKHISALRNAIADRTAGVIAADAEVLSGLSEAEKKIYARLRNVHLFDKQKK